MKLLRAIRGEFRKTMSLPAALVGIAIALLAPLGIALLAAVNNGRPPGAASPSPADVVFNAMALGTVGAVILGVIVVSSEFAVNSPDAGGGRQISATLIAVPSRLIVLVSKVAVVIIVVSLTAAATTTAGLWLVHAIVGSGPDDLLDMVTRSAGVALYWTCMALIAFAVTVLTRSGIAPLVWFIANSSVISVSLLLSKLTPAARYLPDLAGMRLFAAPSSIAVQDPLEPVSGAIVMTAWGLGLLTISATAFSRRDA
ncbi:ABC transporter permease [Microbacterium sp.]|uniref:ABC transporter permease n=1 Tax=Microbacterium sp. TaxID=51671 RepID=UPI00273384CA|nr:ABC transporter permease [Microbacterium sp.]MDP3953001.1 ABC transporter permease [Microbacterium sp.]